MAEPYKHIYKVDLNQPLVRRDVGLLATFDSKANRFGAELYRDGASVSASGYTVNGYFIRPNEETVPIPGTVQGNLVYVDLLPGCYHYDGAFEFSLKIKQGDVEQTVLLCYGTVERSRTDATASGGEVFVTVTNADNLDGKPPEHYLPAVNLLDNSDWRIKKDIINQRGSFSYSTEDDPDGYTIDRWYLTRAGGKLDVHSGYISPSEPLYQKFENAKLTKGKTYTFAACTRDNQIYCFTFTPGTSVYGNIGGYIYHDEETSAVCIYGGESYKWAALYEGAYTAKTLPPYVSRPYAVELAECQKRFVGNTSAWSIATNAGGYLMIKIPTAGTMANDVNPSVCANGNGDTQILISGSWVTLDITPFKNNNVYIGRNEIVLEAPANAFSGVTTEAGKSYLVRRVPNVSADL